MTQFNPLRVALLLATAAPLPVAAQPGAIVQPLTPNADRLSEQMRILGRSPNDVSALIEAGRLSGKLGDTDAAMQFLARAEKVAPNDPRIRAARGISLVAMERPGEALAMFASAERAGVSMTPYLAERGLAYDLLGRGSLAQVDYRQALRAGEDDELTRRLALSLGIDGNLAESTAVLNPLLQKGDRAAWRVRAFVLAMSGDAAGADKITASMLPGFSASLSPFFRRLPQLAGADRAFAVHYGRLAPSPERLADARLAPPLPAPVRTAPPVALASATPAAPVATSARTVTRAPTMAERRAERQRQAQAAQQAQADAARRAADAQAQQLAQARADEAARRAALAQRQQLAAQQAEQARIAEATRVEAQRVAARQAEERRLAAEALAARDRAEQAARPPVQVASAPVPVTIVDRPAEPAPTPPAAAPVEVASVAPPAAAPAVSSAAATVAARTPSNDDVLARIIRNLDIPASELGVGPPPAPVAAPASSAALAADAETARRAAEAREATARAAEAAEAKKLAAARAATAKKAAEAKRIADEKKAAAAEAAREAQAKRADPERHWVQVAGGANVAGLPAAWGIMAGKAPALKGRQAWTTPLRATNRLLTGPFKSDAEAQDFVNTLRKSGVQAFTFTSEAGQKVARVPVK